jgi:nucleoside phosphorylase/ankyrin repeat protein
MVKNSCERATAHLVGIGREDKMATDFVIVTPLAEEREAVLDQLPGHKRLPASQEDIRVYYSAEVPVTIADAEAGRYSVVVVPLANMGLTEAANATGDAVRRWRPRYVLLVGIAGGIEKAGVAVGDILVADQIADYELQKFKDGAGSIRWQVFRVDQRLLIAAQNFPASDWAHAVEPLRPAPGQPKVHLGPICTGNKVVADESLAAQFREVWSKLVGVEMEAGGVASAAFQSASSPGFFMVRGVSDLADGEKDADTTRNWREYACRVSASYAINLLRTGPVPVIPNHIPMPGGTDGVRKAARLQLAAMSLPFSRTEFLNRIKEGDSLAVQLLLDADMNPDVPVNHPARPALVEAAAHGYTEIVRALVKKGAPATMRAKGESLLADAVRSDNLALVEALLEGSADLADHAMGAVLEIAVRRGRSDIVKALIGSGAFMTVPAERVGRVLARAAESGDLTILEMLLAAGADPNARDGERTALNGAVQRRSVDLVRALLERGANPNEGVARIFDKHPGTNLMIAASKGDLEILTDLLTKGADVTQTTTNGVTALMMAAFSGNEACVRALLAKGADPTAERKDGKTARAIAEGRRFEAIATLLADAEG